MERNTDCWYKDVCLAEDGACRNCLKFTEMQHLMDNSNLPKNKQRPILLDAPAVDRDSYARLAEIKSDIVNFVNEGRSLFIGSSHTGNGKTSWAIKLMLRYFDQIWAGNGLRTRAVFIHIPTFLLKCKDFNNKDEDFEQLKRDIINADLVVWDDIAGLSITNYDYSQLLMYVDSRVFAEKSNIFTCNCETYDELQKLVGSKIASRVMTSNTEVITFKSSDLR